MERYTKVCTRFFQFLKNSMKSGSLNVKRAITRLKKGRSMTIELWLVIKQRIITAMKDLKNYALAVPN